MMAIESSRYGHQATDVAKLRGALAAHGARVLYVAFMGSGKTVVAGELLAEWVARGLRVLFLVHRRVLIAQTDIRLRQWLTEADIGWIWRKHPRTRADSPVQIASIDTLVRREMPPDIDLVIVDEAHHAAANKWQTVLGWAKPGTRVLGLTATPERLDGKPLGDLFDVMVQAPDVEQLIASGTVKRPEVWTRADFIVPDMTKAEKRGGDWTDRACAKAMTTVVKCAPELWEKRAEGRPTVGFCSLIKECKRLVKLFRAAGIRAEMVTGQTVDRDRDAILGRLAAGTTKVVWTCDALSEGWDFPGARCVILARPTLSLTKYLQWCGRAMRSGSVMPVILDLAGNFHWLDVPDRVRAWDLYKRRDRNERAFVNVDAEGHVVRMAPDEIEAELVRVTALPAPQTVCCGINGKPCPHQRTPGRFAFDPSMIRRRVATYGDGRWRCGNCGVRKSREKIAPETHARAAVKRLCAMGPEGSREAAKKRYANSPLPERKRLTEPARRALAAARANMTAQQRSAVGRRAAETRRRRGN